MDVNDLRIAVTVSSLVLFLALVAYTWSRKRANEYAAAQMLPFVEDSPVEDGPQPADEQQQGVRS